jgi:hypothetical protein
VNRMSGSSYCDSELVKVFGGGNGKALHRRMAGILGERMESALYGILYSEKSLNPLLPLFPIAILINGGGMMAMTPNLKRL